MGGLACRKSQAPGQGKDGTASSLSLKNKRPEKVPPAPGTKAALVQDGLPWEISWVAFEASQDEEDEKPLIGLQFFEAGDNPVESANLYMDLDELRAFHSSLTAILKDLS
ncbi:hypothetical protein [Arthrobacter sp. zg-Y179]|uniref:hypothetical protein n=1 Tax=Arthrobacter sp. zg-Y179 TaxID=2894188 RepID=UPI001E39F5CB|nr:hypothetical protein [Arthrobacter sp. zg-Y179]MCC9173243.1 hypothetical protein [Arthrobacter sp. zg-Y179]